MNTKDFEKSKYVNEKGETLPYRLLKPQNQNPAEQYPLVLFLHGSGERGSDNETVLPYIAPLFLKEENRKKFPCFLLVPQCPSEDRWAHMDRHSTEMKYQEEPSYAMRLTIQLVETVIKEYSIDPKRIYVIGLSMGGNGTFDILIRKPELFAAGIPICGWCDTSKAPIIAKIPLWVFHGSADTVVDVGFSRDMVVELGKSGGRPKYTEYAGVWHDSWDNAYAEPGLLPWLFQQRKK